MWFWRLSMEYRPISKSRVMGWMLSLLFHWVQLILLNTVENGHHFGSTVVGSTSACSATGLFDFDPYILSSLNLSIYSSRSRTKRRRECNSKQDNWLVKIHCKINKRVHTWVQYSLTFVWGFWFLGWFWGDGYTLSLNNDKILMFQFELEEAPLIPST